MLDKIWKPLYPHIYKDPCYECLTQAVCINKKPWNRTCELKTEWSARRYKMEHLLDDIESWILNGLMFICLLFFAATFVLGIWKWCDLFVYWFR